jgi:enamine deaminase RidA (YjgF/YER057c/UK114 family)
VHTAQFLPVNPTGEIVGEGDATAQTRHLLDSLSNALAAAKTDLEHAVKINVYGRDTASLNAVRAALSARFRGSVAPAVSFVESRTVHSQALVAMDAVATTPMASKEVTFFRGGKTAGSQAAVLPRGRHVYIAGQAANGALADATRKTMESLQATLNFLGLSFAHVVSVKSFVQPITAVPEARAEIVKHFHPDRVPPLVFVEWTMNAPIEIELVAAAGDLAGDSAEPIEYLTPPGMTASPLYSRVARVNRGDIIYVGGLYAADAANGEGQVRDLFRQLTALIEKSGGNLRHLAKATYYVSDEDASFMLNKVRPEFYDPQRPPAASKAPVRGVGLPARSITIDMIAVRPGIRE